MENVKLQFVVHQLDELISELPELKWDESILADALIGISWPLDTSITREEFSIDEISVIFVQEEYIAQLNLEYRQKDEVTDVLSFESGDEIGEVYVCPKYIKNKLADQKITGQVPMMEEIIRMIIHGTLHILGYEHEGYFEWNGGANENIEDMFVEQEVLLKVALTALDV